MESTATASDKPKKWTAALLAILAPFVGMLYVARPGWAAVYFAVAIILAMGNILLFHGAQTVTDVAMLLLAVVCSVHAYRLARDFEDSRTRPWYSRWYGLAGVVTALAVPIFGTRAFFFEPFRFPSGSMEPSIEPPAHLIVKKWGYGNYGTYGIHVARTGISSQVRRGDIIVFEYPEDPSISYAKRVVGLPGDRVSYFNKQLKVNEKDALIKEIGEYIHKKRQIRASQYLERLDDQEYRILIDPEAPVVLMPTRSFPFLDRCTLTAEGVFCRVPNDHYFVLGDNRDNSSDSRIWGFVPARNVVGKVQFILQ